MTPHPSRPLEGKRAPLISRVFLVDMALALASAACTVGSLLYGLHAVGAL